MKPIFGFFIQVPGAEDILASHGITVPQAPNPGTAMAAPAPALPTIERLTRTQQRIVQAMTRPPALNVRQVGVLEVYWCAYHETRAALPISEIAVRLTRLGVVDATRAQDFVKGSLRSFGKRLNGFTDEPVSWVTKGDGADPVPLVVLLETVKGANGEACHRLTKDGAVAVAAALGLPRPGVATDEGGGEEENPDEIVVLAMSRRAASMILRVAKARGISADDAIFQMTAAAGAG